MAVLITDEQNLMNISTDHLRKMAQALLNDLGSPDGELSLLITDDENIEEINREYFNRPWPTNVISFSMMEGQFAAINPDVRMLGDIVISMETAMREANEAMVPIEEHFARLLVHGLLHIFGYDHETPDADALRMEKKTEALMTRLKKARLLAGGTPDNASKKGDNEKHG